MAKKVKDPLLSLPGIGHAMAKDLHMLGIENISDLAGLNPMQMYETLCSLTSTKQDRCVLYVFRCAVWVAENPNFAGDERRNWWAWKDLAINES